MKKEVEYFLNAVYYIFKVKLLKLTINIDHLFDICLYKFFSVMLPKKSQKKIINWHENSMSEYREYLKKPTNIIVSTSVYRFFSIILVLFIFSLFVPIIGLAVKFSDYSNSLSFNLPFLIIIIVGGLSLLISNYFDKMITSDERHLKYFEQFSKKDKEWHRKWGWITFFFSIAPFILLAINFRLCMLIIEL